MSEDKKKNISEQADQIRRELDDLIGDSGMLDVESDPSDMPMKQPRTDLVPRVSYEELKSSATKKAAKTITALMKFYLDADIIEQDEYVQAKKKLDEMTMSSLVYQLHAGERALTTLLQTIEDGELAPRMFEVLATLQKSMLDIIKSQTMYLMATEESVKRIARDADIYKEKTNKQITRDASGGNNDGGNVQRGTRDLMSKIRAGIDIDIEDVEIEDKE